MRIRLRLRLIAKSGSGVLVARVADITAEFRLPDGISIWVVKKPSRLCLWMYVCVSIDSGSFGLVGLGSTVGHLFPYCGGLSVRLQ